MYQNYTVKIPDLPTGITKKTIKGTTYVYYTYGRTYISEKKYSQGKDTSIGKTDPGDDTMMYPNANFFRFFPDEYTGTGKPPVRMTGNRESGHKGTDIDAAKPLSRKKQPPR